MAKILSQILSESIAAKTKLLDSIPADFDRALDHLIQSYTSGGRLYIAGNGGSAADSQHLAAEFVCKLAKPRNAIPAEALTTDTSTLTAIANDFGYEFVFSRQLEAKATPKDMFLGISTSGNSANILEAFKVCQAKSIPSILLSGFEGGKAKSLATYSIIVPGDHTGTIQELHICIYHALCAGVEQALFDL
jgi:D-sedoheptulose 7-phosphate isomerase